MKIVLIGPTYPYRGGIAHYTTLLCRALRERGHDVLLVSFKRQYPQWLFPGQSDRDPSSSPLQVEDAQYWIDSLNPFTWLATFWRIRRYRPQAVILQWWTPFWAPAWFVLGALSRLFLRRPLVFVCHNVLPHERRWWDAALARGVLGWGTHWIVQSADERQRLLELLPGARASVAPLPVFRLAGERSSKEAARRRLKLPLDAPVVLFFGIVRAYKGLHDILQALPALRARLGRVILLVAGEFWEDKQPYLDQIERLGIGDSVIVDDRYLPDEDAGLYFSAADVLVAPYRHVTGSAVVQTAFGFGLPVITTRVGGLGEVVCDGQTGLLVPPGDPGALAEAVARYLSEGQGERMAKAIRQTSPQLSWDRLVASIEEAAGQALG
ncbi:MAG: glycosyltransferase [Thermoflexales bacterium]|nr:glycosyltransferase [Thermoflexales bacterium]